MNLAVSSKTCPACLSENQEAAQACVACGQTFMDEDIRPGSVIADRYELLRLLGRGGTGLVYKAQDRALEETVAIKILRPDIAAKPEMAQRLRSEIKLARRVAHRNVCRIYEYGEDASLRFIVMELVNGHSLRRLLKDRGTPPPHEALGIAVQVADGLEALHKAGIVHRDINPGNLVRDRAGVVKIMDLGIAKVLESAAAEPMTGAGQVVGTPEYMSPEQIRGEKLDLRSDLYALGVVTYELLTGERPFRADSPVATMFMHLQQEPPLESLPEVVRPVLSRALAKRPEDRYSTALEMRDALDRSLQALASAGAGSVLWVAWEEAAPAAASPASAESGPDVSKRSGEVRPLAEMTGLTRALGVASEARVAAQAQQQDRVPSRSRLSQPDFGPIDVFICYRHGDTDDVSGRIHDRLVARFGRKAVFKDVDSIPFGANFKQYLGTVVERCLVELVVIGKSWLDARDEAGARRLEDPSDWVRIEIEAALQRDTLIIPLLVHGSSMPKSQLLPPSLSELAFLQGASVRRDPDFHTDMDRLIAALEKHLPRGRSKAHA